VNSQGAWWALFAATALCISCNAPARDSTTTAELSSRLCTLDDLGGHYVRQTEGDFDSADLATLPHAPPGRENQLAAAGLIRGRLVFWKATVSKPPFEPPLNVYCQALAFDSQQQADAFVAALQPHLADIETLGMAFFPDDGLTVEIQPATGGIRTFELTAHDWAVSGAVRADGRYVTSVLAGGPGAPVAESEATRLLATVALHAGRDSATSPTP
jgi:hypothetical protein